MARVLVTNMDADAQARHAHCLGCRTLLHCSTLMLDLRRTFTEESSEDAVYVCRCRRCMWPRWIALQPPLRIRTSWCACVPITPLSWEPAQTARMCAAMRITPRHQSLIPTPIPAK